MSAHDLMLPDRAISSMIGDLARRVMQLERRLKYPSAVSIGETPGPTALAGSSAYTSLVEIELDPGRWVILGGTRFEFANAGTSSALAMARITTSGSFGSEDVDTRTDGRVGTAGATINATLLFGAESRRNEAVTVTLYGSTTGSYTTMQALDSYLFAIPN